MVHRSARLLLAAALLGVLACPAPCPEDVVPGLACAPEEPGDVFIANPSFEAAGAPLKGWRFVEAEGVMVETGPGVDGCTAVSLVAPTEPLASPARLVTYVDAKELRGQRVRLSLWARVELAHGERGPNMVLRARGGSRWHVLDLNGTELAGDHWRLHSLEFDVPPDTDRLEIQVGLSRIRRLDLDGVAIDRVGPACPGCEAPAPLAAAQRENLVTMTRLLGRLRFAYPGTVEAADWDTLALVGVQAALRVEGAEALAVALERAFSPVAATRSPVAVDKPDGFRPDGGDRTTRLAAIALLGARVAHVSPRLGQLDRPWEDVLRDSFERVAVARDRYELRDEVFRLFTALHEGTGQAHLDWDARLMYALDVGWRWVGDELVVTAADPERTPGLRVGDVIEAIDGRTPADALADLLPLGFGGTEARSRLIATVLLGRGLAGGSRQVQVRHLDGGEQHIKIPYRYVGLAAKPLQHDRIEVLAEGVLYVPLAHVSGADLLEAAGRMQAADAVILDARAGLAKGMFARFRATLGVGGEPLYAGQMPVGGAAAIELPGRIAVLIDERTTGEAEGLADALRALRGALLVGSASAAAPGLLTESALPGGLRLMMVEAPHRYVSGQSVFDPLQPDIAAAPTIAGIAAGRDEVRERALAALTDD